MSEKTQLEQMDAKLDTLVTGQALMNQLLAQHDKKIEEHENLLYGDGIKEPGLIAKVLEATESVTKAKRIALAAATAFVTGLVSLVVGMAKTTFRLGG